MKGLKGRQRETKGDKGRQRESKGNKENHKETKGNQKETKRTIKVIKPLKPPHHGHGTVVVLVVIK